MLGLILSVYQYTSFTVVRIIKKGMVQPMETYNTTFGVAKEIAALKGNENEVTKVIADVYAALREKGYNPINQLVGYIMSGDPTYITNHNGARARITSVERDELVEEFISEYLKGLSEK